VWEAFNQVFDCMPVAAIINEQIFCAHGGIPRPLNHPTLAPYLQAGLQLPPVPAGKLSDGRIEALDALPNQMTLCGGTAENDLQRLIALDCMWADPLPNEHGKEIDRMAAPRFKLDDQPGGSKQSRAVQCCIEIQRPKISLSLSQTSPPCSFSTSPNPAPTPRLSLKHLLPPRFTCVFVLIANACLSIVRLQLRTIC
jgi:hypothetical protein